MTKGGAVAEYAVHVTTTARIDFDDDVVCDDLMDALAPLHAAIGGPDHRFAAQMTVNAASMAAAVGAAERSTLDALAGVGITLGDGGVVGIEVLTPDEFERQLAEPPDLMSTSEVATRLGVSRQRVLILADEHPAFPAGVKIGGGLGFKRDGVERFAALRRIPGRHTDMTAPATGEGSGPRTAPGRAARNEQED
jgi:hypothetical protein